VAKRKKSAVNKTEAILTYAAEHPEVGPTEIVDALGSQGIKVSAQYVSSIRSKHGMAKKRRGRKGKTAAAAPRGRRGDVIFDNLLEAKKFVQSLGNVDKARKVLDAYARLH
jgi:hypothetical protein